MGDEIQGNNDRDDAGRWAAGNTASKGNPAPRRMASMKAELMAAIGDGTIARVTKKLVDMAEGGDVPAIKLLLDHACGKPVQAVEVSGPDGRSLGVDWGQLQAGIMGALAAYPDAKLAVALELRKAGRQGVE